MLIYAWCPDVSATGGFSQVLAGVAIGRDQLLALDLRMLDTPKWRVILLQFISGHLKKTIPDLRSQSSSCVFGRNTHTHHVFELSDSVKEIPTVRTIHSQVQKKIAER